MFRGLQRGRKRGDVWGKGFTDGVYNGRFSTHLLGFQKETAEQMEIRQ